MDGPFPFLNHIAYYMDVLHPCGFFHTPEWQSCLVVASAVAEEIHLADPKSLDF